MTIAVLRRLAGFACVAAAAWLFVIEVPKTVHAINGVVSYDGYVTGPQDRLLTSGDILGISRDLQVQAIANIPPGSSYALLLDDNKSTAQAVYGISTVTAETIGPFLNYLLLPSRPASSIQAGTYLICWGCDTTPWDHRTHWLFTNSHGVAIGRVTR